MYQGNNNSIMMNGICTSTFDNNSSWTHETKRHSPPPPLVMIKQEQPPMFSNTMNGYYGDMCQPLVLDDSSNLPSPTTCTGPMLLSPSTDVFSQSSSPTMDDQWFDLYSPIQSHCTYPMEQRHSFDQAMYINNQNTNPMATQLEEEKPDYPMYCCNTNINTISHYPMETPVPSPSLSSPSLSYYHPYYTNQMPRPTHSPLPAVARHQSMPSIYHYQQQQSPLSSSSSSSSPLPASSSPGSVGLGLGSGYELETEPIRPYRCHLCTRGFARKHDLQRHIRVHTGDKPYACLCCKKAFARTDALKRHLRMEDHCRNSPQIQNMKNTGKRRYKDLE